MLLILSSQFKLQRGDSINKYIVTDGPLYFQFQHAYSTVYDREEENDKSLDVTLEYDDFMFNVAQQLDEIFDAGFMDVDFDGEMEFILASEGYSDKGYACFDVANAPDYKGVLEPMDGVFGRFVDNFNPLITDENKRSKTVFDHENKTIFIAQQIGCCSRTEIWAKLMDGEVKIYKQVEKVVYASGEEHVITYQLIDGTMKQTSHEVKRIDRSSSEN